jgi:hypothetical protein
MSVFSDTIERLDDLPAQSSAVKELVITITEIDPRIMTCTYTTQSLPNGAVISRGPFDVGGNEKTPLDIDLKDSSLQLQTNDYLRVIIKLDLTKVQNMTFIDQDELCATAGSLDAKTVMFRQRGGSAFVSDSQVKFFCKKRAGNQAVLLPYSLGFWASNPGAGSGFRFQVFYDPKIKNDG